jgi:hypothetical protein
LIIFCWQNVGKLGSKLSKVKPIELDFHSNKQDVQILTQVGAILFSSLPHLIPSSTEKIRAIVTM